MIKFDSVDLIASMKRAVEGMTEALGESTLREAGVAGAAVFRDQAIQNAASHRKTGVLMNNIIMKRLEEESDGNKRQSYLVTVRAGKHGAEGDAFYWRFVEDGHSFVRRNAKQGKGANWKGHREASRLEYGTASAPAYPFMRPAYESHKERAVNAMRDALLEAFKKRMGGA